MRVNGRPLKELTEEVNYLASVHGAHEGQEFLIGEVQARIESVQGLDRRLEVLAHGYISWLVVTYQLHRYTRSSETFAHVLHALRSNNSSWNSPR